MHNAGYGRGISMFGYGIRVGESLRFLDVVRPFEADWVFGSPSTVTAWRGDTCVIATLRIHIHETSEFQY